MPIGVGRGGVTVSTPNQSYRLQSPIYPAGSPYQLNSGVPVGVRSPLARLSPPNAAETGPVLTVRVQYTPLEGSEAEFARQLAGQERGINALTAGEIRTNIEKFNAQGRPPGAGGAVGEFRRENPVSEDPFVESYLAQVSQGATPRFAALHEPDLVIGGTVNAVNGYGDLRVNSSLGAQNAYRQDIIYDAVKTVPADTKVRFIFEVKSP
ncbi:hypothetical protein ACVWWJ_002705 [Luteibacter sp. HA06]